MIAASGLTLVPDQQRPPLSVLLRVQTRPLHLAVEAAFALDARLASPAGYAGLLLALRDFYPSLETALSGVEGWDALTPPVDIDARQRAGLIDADLAALGRRPTAPPASSPGTVAIGSVAAGLGCLYVLEGSALGGRIIAGRARAALGDHLPVSFFASAGRPNLAADWRGLRAALDAFGASQPDPVVAETVAAAKATFESLGQRVAAASTR